MSIKDLPGYEAAIRLGYTLVAYGGDRKSAHYQNGDLGLHIQKTPYGKLSADLYSYVGLVRLSVDQLGFPNSNLSLFENEIQEILDAVSLAMNPNREPTWKDGRG